MEKSYLLSTITVDGGLTIASWKAHSNGLRPMQCGFRSLAASGFLLGLFFTTTTPTAQCAKRTGAERPKTEQPGAARHPSLAKTLPDVSLR